MKKTYNHFAVSLEDVQRNFSAYGMLTIGSDSSKDGSRIAFRMRRSKCSR